ncbi:hypothetical protein C8T65DRAFT_636591 [Cerioporus squamosus]|nr:hypothetical protein C8T65DRAFT_636591 [Cerioporus squamosus]
MGLPRAWVAATSRAFCSVLCVCTRCAGSCGVMWTLRSGESRCAAAPFGGKIVYCRLGFRLRVCRRAHGLRAWTVARFVCAGCGVSSAGARGEVQVVWGYDAALIRRSG